VPENKVRLLTTQQAVTIATVMQTLGLPDLLGRHSDVDVDSALLGCDSVWIGYNHPDDFSTMLCYASNATVQPIYDRIPRTERSSVVTVRSKYTQQYEVL
jgi:hypothetical protein